ncbi:hypothetical protein K435DRAFT_881446 [Dendrothele bispora CBS 962.96]|uniref:Uncharacterized protein n=1 Tax=Dendrothele bispora (strain CBS 962.96) TaxID=1314807 RepID=A0A4V4HAE6_DENBC|nr:hypothetical protein K435DRAFT_881446 [Dendrothele bispora CBS 962.96]
MPSQSGALDTGEGWNKIDAGKTSELRILGVLLTGMITSVLGSPYLRVKGFAFTI